MTVTRRRFLRSGAISALVAGFALDSIPSTFAEQLSKHVPARGFLVAAETQQDPALFFKRETFEPYVNGVFKLSAGEKAIEATLVNVRDCKSNPKKSKVTPKSRPTESFALFFRSEEKLSGLTTIYNVEHGALGTMALFLTRRAGPRDTYFYEAVFNRTL